MILISTLNVVLIMLLRVSKCIKDFILHSGGTEFTIILVFYRFPFSRSPYLCLSIAAYRLLSLSLTSFPCFLFLAFQTR